MSKHTKLVCLLMILLLLTGCGAQEAPTEPSAEQTRPTATEPVLADEALTLASGGVSEFRIVYGASAADEVVDAASYLQGEILRLTGAELELTEDMAHTPKTDAWEILVGATDRTEDDLTYAEMVYTGDYLVCVQGRKLTLAANLGDSMTAAVLELCDVLDQYLQSDELILPADFSLSGSAVEGLLARLPAMNGGSFLASCDGGNETMLLIYQADSADCDAYLEKLETFGYTRHTQSEIDGNRYFTCIGGGTTVTVMDNPELRTVRVSVDPAEYAPATEPGEFTAVATPSVTMLGLEGYNTSGSPNQNGMSFLYQCSDGSFIVVDGGHNNSTAARQLYSKMTELAPDPSNIVIAAWLITHSHNDHAGAFLRFTESYAPNVTLEKLLVNFPNDSQYASADTGTTYKTGVLERSTYYPDAEIIKVHPGQIFYLRDAVMKILYTLDLYEPAALTDFNDSSIVCTVELGGQKLLQTGDCGVVTSGILTELYDDALKCDILQVSHHGYTGGTEALYREVDPAYVLWPSGSETFAKYKDASNNVWLLNESNMRKLWVAEDDSFTLTLPITDET